MNKAYLLVICLLLAPFTGCIEDFGLEPVEKVDEKKENQKIQLMKPITLKKKNW
ncbi:MAG: hypothetical protein VYE80_00195 [Candidatus Thermoplasmatota archaeon]|nr:hypothetical protein [Candidatus Thermoplasmatota archaeon]